MSKFDKKVFDSAIRTVKTVTKQRDALQTAIIQAFYKSLDNDTRALATIVTVCDEVKSFDTKAVINYIELLCPVLWREVDGKRSFKINKTAFNELIAMSDDELCEHVTNAGCWYSMAVQSDKVVSIFSEADYMQRVIKKLNKEGSYLLASELEKFIAEKFEIQEVDATAQ